MHPEETDQSSTQVDVAHRPRILLPLDSYLPGHRAGGPVQSIKNLIDALGEEFEFSIVTRDRDLGQHAAYPGIVVGAWQRVGKADVCYLAPRGRYWSVLRILRSKRSDVLYLNSAFSACFTLLPLTLLRIRRKDDGCIVIVAPRGEFSSGALAIHPVKKAVFLRVAKAIRLYRGVTWQATTASEAGDIERVFDGGDIAQAASLTIAADVPGRSYAAARTTPKTAGQARIVFLARISRMKNLRGALEFLRGLKGDITFDIHGPLEDRRYWRECQAALATLPPNITATYLGEVSHERVDALLREHHLLLLPTLGENFGHVIAEALRVGCPVAISDRTPWRGLSDAGAGWDLPLNDVSGWREALSSLVRADQADFDAMSRSAIKCASDLFNYERAVVANREMLRAGLEGSLR